MSSSATRTARTSASARTRTAPSPPPPGRFAKLTYDATTSTYKLQDKSGTTYDFSSSGLLTRITDKSSNVVTYTYSSGKISTALHARSGRSLTFTWTGAHVTKVSTNAVNGAR